MVLLKNGSVAAEKPPRQRKEKAMEKYKVITWNRREKMYTTFCYSYTYADAAGMVEFLRQRYPECIVYAVKIELLKDLLPLLIKIREGGKND
jgi:hypothetical protein